MSEVPDLVRTSTELPMWRVGLDIRERTTSTAASAGDRLVQPSNGGAIQNNEVVTTTHTEKNVDNVISKYLNLETPALTDEELVGSMNSHLQQIAARIGIPMAIRVEQNVLLKRVSHQNVHNCNSCFAGFQIR